jgi:transposase
MNGTDYIGFDVHKKTISYCIKQLDGSIREEGVIDSTRAKLREWVGQRKQGWIGAMEATLFTGWIYDELKPHAVGLKVAHPAMLKAIGASKKKNDRVDAQKIADLLRCDLLPECYMAPTYIRELRRMLRYRNMIVGEAVRMKNKISGLLMETGSVYNKTRLHGEEYFKELVENLEEIPPSVIHLLRLSRGALEMFQSVERQLRGQLRQNPRLKKRVELLKTIPGVGDIVALSWVLEVGEVKRFSSIANAVSYCGLCSAQRSSAGKDHRGPISKQRNRHLQTILIEAAKLAPRWNTQLAAVHDCELKRGSRNRATLAVARKLVAYLVSVDRSGKSFQLRTTGAGSTEIQNQEPSAIEPVQA